ncbi:MAG TPA: glycosyltransferase [Thermoplasmata archaeon]|nr:glycosyltransferase [Thermoplasmata archaeon]HTW77429.1 glycosyltransferase [Thermoplasmata archaeon]
MVELRSTDDDAPPAGPAAGAPGGTIPGSAVVSVYPIATGHGSVASEIAKLGLTESLVLFKAHPHDAESGFDEVVRPRWNPAGLAVFASLYTPSSWGRRIRRFRAVHLTSPHFFHLVRDQPNLTGLVHDVGYLNPSRQSASPPGFRLLFYREIARAHQLRALAAVSATTRDRLRAVHPELDPTVIHNWTGDQFTYREREGARARLGLPMNRTLLLSVGLDIPRKNLDLLPRLAKRLGEKFQIVRIGPSERIAAAFPPGSLLARTQVPALEYPLWFNAVDALLAPSLDEGFGVPLIEAINSQTPIVASEVPIFEEILRGDGTMVPPQDVERWAEACRALEQISDGRRRNCELYRGSGDHYRALRARREYEEFFRRAGFA